MFCLFIVFLLFLFDQHQQHPTAQSMKSSTIIAKRSFITVNK